MPRGCAARRAVRTGDPLADSLSWARRGVAGGWSVYCFGKSSEHVFWCRGMSHRKRGLVGDLGSFPWELGRATSIPDPTPTPMCGGLRDSIPQGVSTVMSLLLADGVDGGLDGGIRRLASNCRRLGANQHRVAGTRGSSRGAVPTGRIRRRARAVRIFGPAWVMASVDLSSPRERTRYPYTHYSNHGPRL